MKKIIIINFLKKNKKIILCLLILLIILIIYYLIFAEIYNCHYGYMKDTYHCHKSSFFNPDCLHCDVHLH